VFYAELARRLDSAYADVHTPAGVDSARSAIFGWAREQLTGAVGQNLETYDWRWFARGTLNNAVVIAQRIYRRNLNQFDEIYVQSGGAIAEAIRSIQVRVLTQPEEDPYRALYSRPGMPSN
jgi:predicted aminopeptidase